MVKVTGYSRGRAYMLHKRVYYQRFNHTRTASFIHTLYTNVVLYTQ